MTNSSIIPIILSASYFSSLLFGQQVSIESSVAPSPPPRESKRIFGIIPNNRTSPSLKDYHPLSPKQKFQIARQASFDRGTVGARSAFRSASTLASNVLKDFCPDVNRKLSHRQPESH
jgi:hypothetical protein